MRKSFVYFLIALFNVKYLGTVFCLVSFHDFVSNSVRKYFPATNKTNCVAFLVFLDMSCILHHSKLIFWITSPLQVSGHKFD